MLIERIVIVRQSAQGSGAARSNEKAGHEAPCRGLVTFEGM